MLYEIRNGDLLEVQYRLANKHSFSWYLPGIFGDFIRVTAIAAIGSIVWLVIGL